MDLKDMLDKLVENHIERMEIKERADKMGVCLREDEYIQFFSGSNIIEIANSIGEEIEEKVLECSKDFSYQYSFRYRGIEFLQLFKNKREMEALKD